MTRDDAKWWVGILGGAAVALAGNFTLFPWIPEWWQHAISLAGFIYAIVSGKLASSPLPGKNEYPNPYRY